MQKVYHTKKCYYMAKILFKDCLRLRIFFPREFMGHYHGWLRLPVLNFTKVRSSFHYWQLQSRSSLAPSLVPRVSYLAVQGKMRDLGKRGCLAPCTLRRRNMQRRFSPAVKPTVHTNPLQKGTFRKRSSKPGEFEKTLVLRFKVDFHCRVSFTCVRT